VLEWCSSASSLINLPHERKLELTWRDKSYCKITLDQGVGYWWIIHGIRPEFPFEAICKTVHGSDFLA
jgi:hypothetical protein